MISNNKYRLGVLAVFQDSDNRLLVFRRIDAPDVWQFPQGGIDPGETPLEALRREVMEEIATDQFEILASSDQKTQYTWPENKQGNNDDHVGQEHWWFLVRFNDGAIPDLESAVDKEFDEYKWVTPAEAISTIIDWKQSAYIYGLGMLGIQ